MPCGRTDVLFVVFGFSGLVSVGTFAHRPLATQAVSACFVVAALAALAAGLRSVFVLLQLLRLVFGDCLSSTSLEPFWFLHV